MQVTDVNLFGDVFKLFDTMYPIGYVYPQYPGQKDPNELWGSISTWEMLDYGGAFFRAANGNAEEFEKTLTITDLNGTNITFEEEHGLLKGSILYDPEGNESRLVDEVTDEHTVVIDRVFTSTTLTNVLIGQYDCFQGHYHKPSLSSVTVGTTSGGGMSGGSYWTYNNTLKILEPIEDDENGTPRIGSETRPGNLTYQLWKRIN